MTTSSETASSPDPPQRPEQDLARRLGHALRLGGIVPPLLTAVLAFLMGGVIVAASGHNPVTAYRAIWTGTGLNWLYELPWSTGSTSGMVLQQTLLQMTTLILTGLAVAFAFRCGMFNIGGQGQYFIGLIVANWVGASFPGLSRPVHVVLAISAAVLAGAVWAGIAGILKATVGAHEVISTIMLNWIAIYLGAYLFGQGGPLQNPLTPSSPISADVAESAKLPVFWGDQVLQGLHWGFFIALAALVVFSLVLNRTTLGYEVRAVGYNPEAARFGGINVKRNYFVAMAISGAFAGLAGAIDMLGYLFHFGTLDIFTNSVGFLGIAVALLGRNTAVGVGLGALLFGALLNGTSSRGLDPNVFDPQLAGNLTLMIQGLIVLFVGADLVILWVWNLRRKKALPRLSGSGA